MQEISRNSVLVSAKGGQIDYVARDGEILMSIAVPAGKVAASEYLDLCPDGAEIQVSKGLVCVNPRSFAMIQTHDLEQESGANPDFEPSSAENQKRRLELMVSRMVQDTSERIVNARMAGLQQVETVPRAQPQAQAQAQETEGDVVEP